MRNYEARMGAKRQLEIFFYHGAYNSSPLRSPPPHPLRPLSSMLSLCLLVEELFHYFERVSKKSHFWSSVLKAIEKELMVLGEEARPRRITKEAI